MDIRTIVVDSSVIVKWLNDDKEDSIEQADKLLGDVQRGEVALITPELAKYEVGNVLLKGKGLSYIQAKVVIEQLYALPIVFVEDTETLAQRTFELAVEVGITYYDASFMALAEQQSAVLITENIKHQGRTSTIQTVALKEY